MAAHPAQLKFRGSIFISYRRADAPGFVRALMSELRNSFGCQQVFLDMEDIEAGNNFPDVIDEALSRCELALIVIGPQWLGARDERGTRRLDNPEDFVRTEVARCLERGIPVIPILIDQARMPASDDLPPGLRPLADLQGILLTYDHWDDDIARLLQVIQSLSMEPRIARDYANAKACIETGRWQEAWQEFEKIHRVSPDYMDVSERLRTLRELSTYATQLQRPNLWRKSVLAWPITTTLILCLVPNLIAALFNYGFNALVIVPGMAARGVTNAERYFHLSVLLVNSIAFPVGVGLLIYFAWPIQRACRSLAERTAAETDLVPARRRILSLGSYAAILCSVLWILAGPVYPLMIGSMVPQDYLLFMLSLTICGVMAAIYPCIYLSWLATHVLYPALLQPNTIVHEEFRLFTRLHIWKFVALLAAGAVPLLIVTLGLALSTQLSAANSLLALLGFVGIGGFGSALWLFGTIQRDLAMLKDLAKAYGGRALLEQAASATTLYHNTDLMGVR